MPRYIHVIINPTAGKDRPILATLNTIFQAAGVKWEASITTPDKPAALWAREALAAGADIVAAYGGDGTVMEVASVLRDTDTLLAILPGGTANVMAAELQIPDKLEEAARIACGLGSHPVAIDMGDVEGIGTFILRIGIGLHANMTEGADRELKNKLGSLAYAISALKAAREPVVSAYTIGLDGKTVTRDGLACLVTNAGSIGYSGFSLSPTISVRDGRLDVMVLRQVDLATLMHVITRLAANAEPDSPHIEHWQAQHVEIAAEPEQAVERDGEMSGTTPLSIRVLPEAVRVLVPENGTMR